MNSRSATRADLDAVTEVITTSFHDDPVWGWAFPDPGRRPQQYRAFWRLLVAGALRYPWVRVTDGCEAATVWIPPGGTELTPEQEGELEPLLRELVGDGQARLVLELIERFEAAHPRDEPHYYLSLFGTHTSHRGKGIGMRLLADDLSLIDGEGLPAYLESTNDANLDRYASMGFVRYGAFSCPNGGPTLTTMWRPAR